MWHSGDSSEYRRLETGVIISSVVLDTTFPSEPFFLNLKMKSLDHLLSQDILTFTMYYTPYKHPAYSGKGNLTTVLKGLAQNEQRN